MRTKNIIPAHILLLVRFAWLGGACAQVDQAWVARYNGPGGLNDYGQDLAVDNTGNIYVTGSIGLSDGTSDFLTIKYDPDGRPLWQARYDGPEHRNDAPEHIALDSAGNVFVSGRTAGMSGDVNDYWDFVTVKYDPSGKQLWAALYNSPGNGDDQGTRLAVDAAGNAYVTGSSATIKYDSNGAQLWVAPNGGSAVAVDTTGNVYVTRWSLTEKYDANGNELWMSTNQMAAYALAVDQSGNVYVTGSAASPPNDAQDYATVKYDAGGRQLWVRRYQGPGNGFDSALAMSLDPAGNIIVTGKSMNAGFGYDFPTIKYDSNGSQLWVNRFPGPVAGDWYSGAAGLVVDKEGNTYITVSSASAFDLGYDFATVKDGANGDQLWVARYNGSGTSRGSAYHVAVDNAKNVYVTGYSLGDLTGYDFVTVKYLQHEPIPTTLTSPKFLPSGAFQFTLNSETGKVLHVQASVDLISWTTLTNFFSPSGINLISDPSAANFKQRFYKAWTE